MEHNHIEEEVSSSVGATGAVETHHSHGHDGQHEDSHPVSEEVTDEAELSDEAEETDETEETDESDDALEEDEESEETMHETEESEEA